MGRGRYGGRSPLSPKKDFKEFDFDFNDFNKE